MNQAMSMPLRALGLAPVADDSEEARDREAIARCLAGDRQAFAPIARRYGPALFAFCSRMVGRAVAEELAQETLVRAFTGLGSFRSDSTLKHWLYRIALNLCRDHLKSGKAREDAIGDLTGPMEPADSAAGPEDRVLGREAVTALAKAIEQLPLKYREALVLKHVENLSYEEMRPITGMPVAALKVRVHRAREMLRGALAQAGLPLGDER